VAHITGQQWLLAVTGDWGVGIVSVNNVYASAVCTSQVRRNRSCHLCRVNASLNLSLFPLRINRRSKITIQALPPPYTPVKRGFQPAVEQHTRARCLIISSSVTFVHARHRLIELDHVSVVVLTVMIIRLCRNMVPRSFSNGRAEVRKFNRQLMNK
jgi:hypothetical protein